MRRSVLFGASALALWSAQLACTGDMKQVSGCQSDAQCAEGQICRASDGKCVPKPTYATVKIEKLGDGSGTVTSSPAGLDCGSTCSADFEVGVPVTLTATAASGSSLGSFTVGCASGQTTCSFTPMSTDAVPIRVLVNFSLGGGSVTPALCNSSNFCWENPKPAGNRLYDVAVLSAGDAWAVGDAGTVVHRSGGSFSLVSTGTTKNLYAIWGSGSELYAVGEGGTILHGSGGVFAAENSGITTDLYDVWGSGGTVLTVGAGGKILRRSSSVSWPMETSNTTAELRGIFGNSTSDIWAVGALGTATHYTGTWAASNPTAFGSYTIRGIAGSGSGSLYAVDSFGSIYSYTSSWASVRSMPASDDLYGVSVIATTPYVVGNNVGAMVLRYTGSNWVRDVTGQDGFRAIGGSSANDLWAVGESGTVWQSDGSPWTPRSSGLTASLNGVWTTDSQHAWAVGANGTVLLYNGSYVTPINIGASGTMLNSVWAANSTDVLVVGNGGLAMHYNGTNWVSTPTGTSQNLRSVHGVSATSAVAVGDGGTALLWNGSTWSAVSTGGGTNLTAVWAASATDMIAVGAGGTVLKSSGGNFSAVTSPGTATTLGGVAGGSGNDFWVSGDTTLYHYTSGTWTPTTPTPTVNGLRGMWALNGTDIYAVGAGGALLHYTGVSWSRVPTGAGPDLAAVAVAQRRLWTVGTGGTVLRQDF